MPASLTTVTKEIEFDAGHRVPNHASKCRNPHGHRYKVIAHVSGDLVAEEGDSQEGMVLDFGFIKELLTEHVHDVFDHGFIVHGEDEVMCRALEVNGTPLDDGTYDTQNPEDFKVIIVPYIPTAENLARAIYKSLYWRVRKLCGDRAWLSRIEVYETPTSRAMYGNQPR